MENIKIKILIIEDNQSMQAMYRRWFSDYDLKIMDSAPKEIDWHYWDLLILDHSLNGGDSGLQWLQSQTKTNGCTICAVSGTFSKDLYLSYIDAAADYVFPKENDLTSLEYRLNRVLIKIRKKLGVIESIKSSYGIQ